MKCPHQTQLRGLPDLLDLVPPDVDLVLVGEEQTESSGTGVHRPLAGTTVVDLSWRERKEETERKEEGSSYQCVCMSLY